MTFWVHASSSVHVRERWTSDDRSCFYFGFVSYVPEVGEKTSRKAEAMGIEKKNACGEDQKAVYL